MEKTRVYLDNCREYDPRTIERIVTDGIAYLGVKIPRQSKILLKPNVLSAHPPERHITTHPTVIEAVVKVLLDNGNEIVIADSSSLPGGTGRALERSGIAAIGKRFARVSVVPFEEIPTRSFTNPANQYLPQVNLPRILDDVECVINLPKLKSHALVWLTAAVKNFFGCIPGGGKQHAHVTAPSGEELSVLLVDLYAFLRPKILLNILDGIVGLDGFGPGSTGRINRAGFMILSTDAVALDRACSRVIRIDPDKIWTNRFAVQRGLGAADFETNQDLEPVRFWLPRPFPVPSLFSRYISGVQRRRPTVIEDKCEQCGVCAKVCPVTCITMDGYPQWDYRRCIYCYCCHESCPHAAIKLKLAFFHGQR